MKNELPYEVELLPNHIGAIGEALFEATYGPPDPVPELVREFCDEVSPEQVDVDALNIQSMPQSEKFYVSEIDGEEMTWNSDGWVKAWYRPSFEDREGDTDISLHGWYYGFPVEIKTGDRARLEGDQRAVMEHLAKQDEIQPILLRLGIDELPEAFTVETVEFV